jgi:hypothetical protein
VVSTVRRKLGVAVAARDDGAMVVGQRKVSYKFESADS